MNQFNGSTKLNVDTNTLTIVLQALKLNKSLAYFKLNIQGIINLFIIKKNNMKINDYEIFFLI